MKSGLEKLSEIVAKVREEPYRTLREKETFEDLDVDSLGRLMVLVGVATEYKIEGTEEEAIHLVHEMSTVGDVLEYVERHTGK
jgi:acyl carrier protein